MALSHPESLKVALLFQSLVAGAVAVIFQDESVAVSTVAELDMDTARKQRPSVASANDRRTADKVHFMI